MNRRRFLSGLILVPFIRRWLPSAPALAEVSAVGRYSSLGDLQFTPVDTSEAFTRLIGVCSRIIDPDERLIEIEVLPAARERLEQSGTIHIRSHETVMVGDLMALDADRRVRVAGSLYCDDGEATI